MALDLYMKKIPAGVKPRSQGMNIGILWEAKI